MTTAITNTAAPQTIGGTPIGPATGLTAEGIMAYCASRLNSLDTLIQNRFEEQKKRNAGLKEAGELIAHLNQWSYVSPGSTLQGDPAGQTAHRRNGADLAKMYNSATDPEVKGKIAEAFRVVTGTNLVVADGKAALSQLDPANIKLELSEIKEMKGTEWQTYIGGVKTVQDGLTKDSELSMIQLQSVVSQRQLAVQMTTQLLQTMHESSKQVVSNIR